MSVTIRVITKGLEQKLARLDGKLRNPRAANKAVSVALYGWVIRNYDSEGQSVGGWAPLAPSTVKRKTRTGHTRKLVESGQMRASILPFFDSGQAGVGTPLTSIRGAPYPLFHQEGTDRMPARPFLPDKDTALDIGMKVYRWFIGQSIKEAGL